MDVDEFLRMLPPIITRHVYTTRSFVAILAYLGAKLFFLPFLSNTAVTACVGKLWRCIPRHRAQNMDRYPQQRQCICILWWCAFGGTQIRDAPWCSLHHRITDPSFPGGHLCTDGFLLDVLVPCAYHICCLQTFHWHLSFSSAWTQAHIIPFREPSRVVSVSGW